MVFCGVREFQQLFQAPHNLLTGQQPAYIFTLHNVRFQAVTSGRRTTSPGAMAHSVRSTTGTYLRFCSSSREVTEKYEML